VDNLTINFYSPCTPLLVPGPNQTRPGNVNSSGLVGGPINTPRNRSGRFDGHIKPAPDDWAVIKGELNVIHPHASCEGASGSKVTNIVVLDPGFVSPELGDDLLEASRHVVLEFVLSDIEFERHSNAPLKRPRACGTELMKPFEDSDIRLGTTGE